MNAPTAKQLAIEELRGRPPIRLRASSVGSLFDCPARWIAIHIEGKRTPQSDKAALGTAIHAGTAAFDLEVLNGQTPSVAAATDAAVDSLRNPEHETVWDTDQEKCVSIAASLTAKYCQTEAPKHNFVAVEAKCESLILEDVGLELTGTTDRIEQTARGLGIRDIKSGKQAVGSDGRVKTDGHGAQMGVYELLAEASTGVAMTAPAQIIGLQTNLTADKQRIGTGEIEGAKLALLGDDQHQGLLTSAALIAHGVIAPWGNPKSMMCHQNYCANFNTCFWRK